MMIFVMIKIKKEGCTNFFLFWLFTSLKKETNEITLEGFGSLLEISTKIKKEGCTNFFSFWLFTSLKKETNETALEGFGSLLEISTRKKRIKKVSHLKIFF